MKGDLIQEVKSSREDVTDVTNMGTSVNIARLRKWRKVIWIRESINCIKSDVSWMVIGQWAKHPDVSRHRYVFENRLTE